MRRSMRVMLAVAGLGGSVLTGCGGDKSLSKAEFIKKGDAICTKGNQEINAAAKKAFGNGSQPSKTQIAKFAKDDAIPAIETQISDLRGLAPPKADKAKVKKILDTANAALDKIKADPSILAGQQPFEESNKLAGDYGLKACAQ